MPDKKFDEFIFGTIPGTQIGDVFKDRAELAASGIHKRNMHGIWGREAEGTCSIVLSGGYEDDIDELDYIYYTGEGGQDAPGGKQVSDQEFSKGNKGLQLSYEYKLPVRVTRGYQVENGPPSGYRYDGLYYVTHTERVRGKSGYFICRFHLQSENSIYDLEEKLKDSLPKNYVITKRTEVTFNRINRNVKLREKIKQIYNFRCQVCGIHLHKPNGSIAVGAHIKGLGKPHNGPDNLSNMLCLCPNHHEQFDALSFYIDPVNFMVVGLEEFQGKKINLSGRHKLDSDFLSYHKSLYNEKYNG